MNKVFAVVRFRRDNNAEERILYLFAKKQDANDEARRLNAIHEKDPYNVILYAVRIQHVISAEEEEDRVR